MARSGRFFLLLLLTVLCTGCGVVGEERMYYMKKDWQRFKGPVWQDSVEDLGVLDIVPTATRQEAAHERRICLHGNGTNRVMMQDGVNDELGYRRCVLAPYQTEAGSRMGNRPEGLGQPVRE